MTQPAVDRFTGHYPILAHFFILSTSDQQSRPSKMDPSKPYLHDRSSLQGVDGPSTPHRRHRTSLEGVIDPSACGGSPHERDRAQAVFYSIVNHFERVTVEKPYNRPRLVRLIYEHARSEDSRWLVLQEFFTSVNILMDASIDFDDATVVKEVGSNMNSFADFLVNNFFLPLKASASRTPQPSPAHSSQPPSRFSALESVERLASLRRACLIRDRHRCVISRKFDKKEARRRVAEKGYDDASDDDGHLLKDQERGSFVELEVAHILPHSLMVRTANEDLVQRYGTDDT
ncbi:hypothetical protein EDB80DRAFT_268540 [Ilyonectria destructans]|nr:hypothetical protein BKA56DRAFT_244764 [Ilyonectria sp. MPI-CAGE-AT-0026]KAH6976794.1 hypothetical protein EDB80DRAFT_268540 [Ilyonectria destructans]